MAYSILPLASFERIFAKLDSNIQKRAAEKIDQLAAHPETIGAPMKNLPPDLRGLHKVRVGHWRIFFWVDTRKEELVLYDINRRDKAYRSLYQRG